LSEPPAEREVHLERDVHAELAARLEAARLGGPERYRRRQVEAGKLLVRDRLKLLLDAEADFEDGLLARSEEGLAGDAVVTAVGRLGGRTVCVIANDYTVKAGTWGNIFYNQVQLSGRVPQVCIMFGPSPAGSAYVPALCDLPVMVEGAATAYLGSPRMSEMATGEKVTLEETGGARMHCEVSGLGDALVASEHEAVGLLRDWLAFFPSSWRQDPERTDARPPAEGPPMHTIIPERENVAFDNHKVVRALVDEASFVEYKALFARELVTGLARLDGWLVGIVANQSMHKGGSAVPGLLGQGGTLRVAVQRLQHPAAVPGRRPRLHDRLGGQTAGHHPAWRQDAVRGGGEPCPASRCWSARPTAAATWRCPAAPWHPLPCLPWPPPNQPSWAPTPR
jgi:acetyl-CoA carboxylase carboxyltransferase component